MEAAGKHCSLADCSHLYPVQTRVSCGASVGIIALLLKCTCVSRFEEVDVTEMEFRADGEGEAEAAALAAALINPLHSLLL